VLPPFNTAILNGFNLLLSDKKKLGSWASYLQMREVMITLNDEHRSMLSKDLGAIAGWGAVIGQPEKGKSLEFAFRNHDWQNRFVEECWIGAPT
jgi:hypothetical protein